MSGQLANHEGGGVDQVGNMSSNTVDAAAVAAGTSNAGEAVVAGVEQSVSVPADITIAVLNTLV